jgi:hypothetical protein
MATADPSPAVAAPIDAPKTEPTTTAELPAAGTIEAAAGSEDAGQGASPKPLEPQAATQAADASAARADAAVAAPAVDAANANVNGSGPSSRASSITAAIPSKDDTNPLDYQGDVPTNNNLPSQETLRKLEKYTVLDESGKSHTFKSLYTGPNVARRVLIIFVRHFFCGVREPNFAPVPVPPNVATN